MYYKSKQIAKALLQLCQEKPDKEDEILKNLLTFCQRKNLMSQLPNILKHLELEAERLADTQKCFIKTGQTLSEQTIESIKQHIKIPDGVDTQIEGDKSIGGGFVARHKGVVYDGSVKRQLERLKSNLKIH